MADFTVQIPDDLHEKIVQAAQHQGMSIDAFVQLCLSSVVKTKEDSLFSDLTVYTDDAPSDLAEKHDDYLYGDRS